MINLFLWITKGFVDHWPFWWQLNTRLISICTIKFDIVLNDL